MIYGELEHLDHYLRNIQDKPLYQALSHLQELYQGHKEKMASLQFPKEVMEGEGFRYFLVSFTTQEEKQKRFEAHKKFYDIHVVLEGEESVQVCDISKLENLSEYTDDIYFGDCSSRSVFQGKLRAGSFLIVFAEDAHKVGYHEEKEVPASVKKLLYKVAV